MPRVHLRSLTSLRFFAALSVALYHADLQSSPDLMAPLRFGFVGVTFFFLLSGFVLTWSAQPADRVLNFYRRRLARVWPLHALTICAVGVLAAIGLNDPKGGWSAVPLNVTLLQAWSTDMDTIFSLNGVSWSLSVEMFFYATFPALLLMARRIGPQGWLGLSLGWLVVGGLLITYGTTGEQLLFSYPLYRVGEFGVGVGLALLARLGRLPKVPVGLGFTAALGAYAAVLVANRLTGGWLAHHQWMVALVMVGGFAVLITACAGRDLVGGRGWLTQAWPVRLGQWSFALYMIHELMLLAGRPMIEGRFGVALLIVVLAVVVAGAVFEGFERPLERRLRGRGRPSPQLESAQ